MNITTFANALRVVSWGMGVLSIIFSMLALRYFLQRNPPMKVRQHVRRVSLTYVSFVTFGMVDTATHWSQPFRWQLFAYLIVFILGINAQAPLVAYERSAVQYGGPAPEPTARIVAPGYQTTLSTTAILVIVAVLTLAGGVSLLPSQLRSPAFDPIRLSTQHVLNRVDGLSGPALHLGEELQVVAVKCNTSGKEIGISGHSRWVSAEPGGTIVDGTVGSGIRAAMPRCPEFNYSNKFPVDVVARTQELFDQGRDAVSWTYTGVETPLGPRGVERAWSTEVFKIVR